MAAVLAAALAACPALDLMEAARVLDDIEAIDASSALKSGTPAPRRTLLSYEVEGRPGAGYLFTPGEPVGAPLVLVPGLSPAGIDDPRLQALALTLARARFLVLVPDVSGGRTLQIGSADARAIGDAAIHLGRLAEPIGFPGVGLAAISYAVGPAMLAALLPDVAPRMRFIVGIGGYYDSVAMIRFMVTGAYREGDGGPWRHREPLPYSRWVFLLSNADRVENPADRARLRAMANRRLADPSAAIDDLVQALGSEGRAVHELLTGRDPDQVEALIALLPRDVQAEIAALTLKGRDFAGLGARVILIHGREDDMIPYTESEALARAIPGAELFIVDGFSHVDRREIGLAGQWTLMRAMRSFLGVRRPAP